MSAASVPVVANIPEATRLKIFSGVVECIERWGIEKTTMNDIARSAGVSRQTVYNYFPGKAEVLEAALEESGREFMDRVESHAMQFEDAATSLLEAMVFTIVNLPQEPYLKVMADTHFSEIFSIFYNSELSQQRIAEVTLLCLRNAPELLAQVDEIGEFTSRFIFSLITNPGPVARSENELREFLRRRMLPGLLQT